MRRVQNASVHPAEGVGKAAAETATESQHWLHDCSFLAAVEGVKNVFFIGLKYRL
jgi:hypothetical protein